MKYKVIGYGSLVSHKDFKRTIPDRHFTPVLIKDYKRIFNLALKSHGYPNVLNVENAKNKTLNGVLFELTKKELTNLMKREFAYNLEETWVYDFLTEKKLCKAYVVVDHIVAIDKKKRKPNKKYFTLCREAAYHISKQFGEYWDNTTYTSGGEKIKSWIKNNPSFDTIKN